VLALTLVPAAQAANLLIDDSVEEEITLTHDANSEFGVPSNGTLFPGSGAPGPNGGVSGSTTAPGEVATFGGSWFVNTAGDPDPGAGVIYFVDQASTGRPDTPLTKQAAAVAGQEKSCAGPIRHRRAVAIHATQE
jgi:hypothetical protein